MFKQDTDNLVIFLCQIFMGKVAMVACLKCSAREHSLPVCILGEIRILVSFSLQIYGYQKNVTQGVDKSNSVILMQKNAGLEDGKTGMLFQLMNW